MSTLKNPESAPVAVPPPSPCSTFSGDIPPEIRALMDSDRADAEAGLWWMIEHPRQNGAYWTGAGWQDINGPVMRFTTRGEAEWEMKARAILGVLAAKITQHGPAEEYIPEGYHVIEDLDGERLVKNDGDNMPNAECSDPKGSPATPGSEF